MISTLQWESWQAWSGKSGFSSDISRISNSCFSKTTALISCIRFWIDVFILLKDSYAGESLVVFLTLAWAFPSKSPSTTFSLKSAFLSIKSIVVCSIYHFCATLTENIAVQLRLLLNSIVNIRHLSTLQIKNFFWAVARYQSFQSATHVNKQHKKHTHIKHGR